MKIDLDKVKIEDDPIIEPDDSGNSGSGSGSSVDYGPPIASNKKAISANASKISNHESRITVIEANQRRELESITDFVTSLQLEMSKGLDKDANGLVYCYNFIFDRETNDALPDALRSMNNQYYDEDTEAFASIQAGGRRFGKIVKMSFSDFYNSIPDTPNEHYAHNAKVTAKQFADMAGIKL